LGKTHENDGEIMLTTNHNFESEEIATMIGFIVILFLVWVLYGVFLYGITYLLVTGLAYHFKYVCPTDFWRILFIILFAQSAWGIYRCVKK